MSTAARKRSLELPTGPPARNDYADHHLHTGSLPAEHVRNRDAPMTGYPRRERLVQLKQAAVAAQATRPYGCRVAPGEVVPTLHRWINHHKLTFDVVMVGALTDNQMILPVLLQLPLHKLCAKPGFLFVWAPTHKIHELLRLLNSELWNKRFRRLEELVFVAVDKSLPYYPGGAGAVPMFERTQWHCWMCITGTVRRAVDSHLIHCNVDTDLCVEPSKHAGRDAVPNQMYQVVENFSSATRRLHIVPSRTGASQAVKVRPGWVVMSPDVLVDNFDAAEYREEVERVGRNVRESEEIEALRPKSPVRKR